MDEAIVLLVERIKVKLCIQAMSMITLHSRTNIHELLRTLINGFVQNINVAHDPMFQCCIASSVSSSFPFEMAIGKAHVQPIGLNLTPVDREDQA
jgi:hypothetical protein